MWRVGEVAEVVRKAGQRTSREETYMMEKLRQVHIPGAWRASTHHRLS